MGCIFTVAVAFIIGLLGEGLLGSRIGFVAGWLVGVIGASSLVHLLEEG